MKSLKRWQVTLIAVLTVLVFAWLWTSALYSPG